MQNWCQYFLDTEEGINSIVYYTHLIPIVILGLIGFYILKKKTKESNSFLLFILFFILWLVGDFITWISVSPDLIMTVWSVLDMVEIVMFLLGLNFFFSLNLNQDNKYTKNFSWVLLIITLPAFYISVRGLSVTGFDYSVCEAQESGFLGLYKVVSNIFVMLTLVVSSILFYRSKKTKSKEEKRLSLYVGVSLLLLLVTFSATGFISSQTGIYEILLFGLFAIPVFLLAIVFTITRLNLFDLRLWSQQLIAYALVVLVFSELFFTKNTIGFVLTSITVVMSIIFVMILTRSIRRESEARKELNITNKKLEESNQRLRELDEQKTEFISLASHQLRGPLTAIKGYSSMLLEGDFGQLSSQIKEAIETVFKSTQALVVIVGDYLDITRIEQGRMKYDFVDFDVKDLVQTVVTEVTPSVALSHLSINFSFDSRFSYMVRADQGKIKQVISNLIDNSIKYTKQGEINVTVGFDKRHNILISVKDTGVGIDPEVLPRLFEKFSRAPDASKANIMGTGLGLYVARKIMEAHRGKVWAESEGKNKGSTFCIELEPINPMNRPSFKEIDGNFSTEGNLERE
jgi:signal transduction histidine kinase